MIFLFNLLIVGLVIAVVVYVLPEFRKRQVCLPASQENSLSACASRNGFAGHAKKRIVGLCPHVWEDGVHLEFYMPPNKRGITSPITHFVSTRGRDRLGTIYEMGTESGSSYLVSMNDENAKQVLTAFYTWKNEAKRVVAKGS